MLDASDESVVVKVDEFDLMDEMNTLDVLVEIAGLMFEASDWDACLGAVGELVIEIVACMAFHADMMLDKDA